MRHLDAVNDPNKSSKVEPYALREIGQKAAKLYLDSGTPMVEAVASVVKEDPRRLNNHHVQRIVEYANHHAFRELRSRTLGDDGDPVQFDGGPASAVSVLAKIRGDVQLRKEAYMSPLNSRMDLLGQVQHMIESTETVGMSKAASARAGSNVDAYDLLTKLGEAAQRLEVETLLLTEKKAAALSEVCSQAGYLLRTGESPWMIRKIAESVAGPHHTDLLKEGMEVIRAQVFPRLGIEDSQDPGQEMSKVASMKPNPNHPLYKALQAFLKHGEDLQVSFLAHESILRNRQDLFGAMRRAS